MKKFEEYLGYYPGKTFAELPPYLTAIILQICGVAEMIYCIESEVARNYMRRHIRKKKLVERILNWNKYAYYQGVDGVYRFQRIADAITDVLPEVVLCGSSFLKLPNGANVQSLGFRYKFYDESEGLRKLDDCEEIEIRSRKQIEEEERLELENEYFED